MDPIANQRRLVRNPSTPAQLLNHPALASRRRNPRIGRPQAVPFNPLAPAQRRLTLNDRKRIIYLRYESLTDFAGPIRRGYTEISRQLRIPTSTVRLTLTNFVIREHDLGRLVHKVAKYKGYTPRLQRALLNPKLLQ